MNAEPYRSRRTAARLAVGLLILTIVAAAVLFVIGLTAGSGIERPTAIQLEGMQQRENILTLVLFIVGTGQGVAFLFWLYRASESAHRVEERALRFSPGWAVGWHLIPVMNFVRPYQVVRELWLICAPECAEREHFPKAPMVLLWWSTIVLFVLGLLLLPSADLPLAMRLSPAMMATVGLGTAAALLQLKLIMTMEKGLKAAEASRTASPQED